MKTEIPAEGIMKTGEFGDSKFYKVVCSCGQPDHDVNFEVEADETGVNVNTYVIAKSDYWSETFVRRFDIDSTWLQEWDWFWKDLVNDVVRRVKLTWRIWTRGYVQTETTIAMTEQQALNYAETLKKAIQDVKKFQLKENKSQEVKQALKEANEQDCV
jgi:hypothetical protein